MKEVLIVEDNEESIVALKKILHEITKDVIVWTANDYEKAQKIVLEHVIDVFIVDIILHRDNPNDLSGLSFIQFIRGIKRYEYSPVIITTFVGSLKEYAYDILDCYKYLEKPYRYEDAFRVIFKALNMPLNYEEKRYLHVRSDGVVNVIRVNEIVCILYENRKLTIYTIHGMLQIFYTSLSYIHQQLQEHNFVRCNQSAIVNKDYVERVDIKNCIVYLQKPYNPVKIGIAHKKKTVDALTK